MSGCIREICMLSLLFGVLRHITPEGSIKKISGALCSAILVCAFLSDIRGTDFTAFFRETARYRENTEVILQNAENSRERLSRLVIEDECEAYILDKAAELGIVLHGAEVSARWSTEGFWLPESVTLEGVLSETQKTALTDIIETELGIKGERQLWRN